MAKFKGLLGKGKGVMKGAITTVKDVALITGGAIAAQKFLDFKTIFPNVDPNKWFIKHEGAIKVGAVVLTLAMWKKAPEWLKFVLWGIAVQGALKEIRTLTMNAEGKAFFDSIGAGAYDNEIKEAARNIEGITTEYQSGVSGEEQGVGTTDMRIQRDPAVTLSQNSQTGVSGMGMGDYDNDLMAA